MARRDHRTGCMSRVRQVLSRHCIFMSGRLYGNYLASSYVVVKLLYCVNAVGQLFLLDILLGYDYHVLGVYVIRHLLFGEKWIPSERLVTQTRCCMLLNILTNNLYLLHSYAMKHFTTYSAVLDFLLFAVHKLQLDKFDIVRKDVNIVRTVDRCQDSSSWPTFKGCLHKFVNGLKIRLNG